MCFTLVAIETTGAFNIEALQLLQEIGKRCTELIGHKEDGLPVSANFSSNSMRQRPLYPGTLISFTSL